MNERLETIKAAVVFGKHGEIVDLVTRAVDAGDDPNRIINEALIAAMDLRFSTPRRGFTISRPFFIVKADTSISGT
jgi:hypothetical protein